MTRISPEPWQLKVADVWAGVPDFHSLEGVKTIAFNVNVSKSDPRGAQQSIQ
jgi:hypothetical protein